MTLTAGKNSVSIKTIDEGLNANGVLSGSYLKTGYAYTIEDGEAENTIICKF